MHWIPHSTPMKWGISIVAQTSLVDLIYISAKAIWQQFWIFLACAACFTAKWISEITLQYNYNEHWRAIFNSQTCTLYQR